MSRIGRKPIPIPAGVQVTLQGRAVTVQGPRGELAWTVPSQITVSQEEGQLVVARPSDVRAVRALHGLTRALLNNMVLGVTQGFAKTVELQGVGYRVQQAGAGIVLQVGYTHPVEVQPPAGVTLRVEGTTRVHVEGRDKQAVGEMAAQLRFIRPPNVYTGKGIRYLNEQVRRKAGKSTGRKR